MDRAGPGPGSESQPARAGMRADPNDQGCGRDGATGSCGREETQLLELPVAQLKYNRAERKLRDYFKLFTQL
jgi:hypothetical protein